MFLPHELIIQILLRLPVKSLMRFKCVCKLWFSLISYDSHFANSHFQLTSSSQSHTRRILFLSNSFTQTWSIDLETSLHDDSSAVAHKLNYVLPQYYRNREINASCNGFIYFYHSVLWNPSTGVHKEIPLSPINSNFEASCFCYLHGFGYDHSTDDYLVVLMSYNPDLDPISHLEFFSLRANTWKEIEGTSFPYMNASDDPRVGSLFNGAIHWLAFRSDISTDVIVAFDLTERKLLEMSLPDNVDVYFDPNYCDLWVFGEFLSLWSITGNDTVEIWVMKEYKVHSSWTMTLSLPIHGISTRYFLPICCTNSGDIIGTDGGTGLEKYDDRGQLLEYRSYGIEQFGSQLAVYTESLLSLPGDGMQA